jgi:hypothetical protein
VAAALAAGVLILLAAIVMLDFELAEWLAAEGHALEITQAALFLVSGFLSGARGIRRARQGHAPAPELLLTFVFGVLLFGELDLDRRLFGIRVVHTRFFANATVWLPYRVLAALVIVGSYAVVGTYCARHRREIARLRHQLTRRPWGHLLIAGAGLFGLVQILEHPLGRIPSMPRFYVEESLELVAAVYLLIAMVELTWRAADDSPDGSSDPAG